MKNFYRTAREVEDLNNEIKTNSKDNFYYLKVFSQEEETKEIECIASQVDYANVIIVRCYR